MNYQSEVLEKIIKKYHIINKQIINFSLLQNICKNEKILSKDLIYLLGISGQSYYRLKKRYSKTAYVKYNRELKFKDNNEIRKFIKIGWINFNQFQNLTTHLNCKDYELRKALGISNYFYKKMKMDNNITVRVIDIEIKNRADLLKTDLNYLSKYGNRYYHMKELDQICKSRKITIEQFLMFYSKNYKQFKFNKLALSKNKNGLWIGKKRKISIKFWKENYSLIQNKCQAISYQIAETYQCMDMREDLMETGENKIYTDCGIIEKNFNFNKKLMINIFGSIIRHTMINYYKKNQLYHYDSMEIGQDRCHFFADCTYRPDSIMLDAENKNELYSNDILCNLSQYDDYEVGFSEIANKMNISKISLKRMLKVQLMENGCVKKSRDGRVFI